MPPPDAWLFPLTLFAALGCGLMGGVFLAFSSVVMQALARLPAPSGMAAMQSINLTVIGSLFLMLFMLTALACGVLGLSVLLRWQGAFSAYVLAGGVLYLVGNLGVTLVCNVPLNNALAPLDASSTEAARVWSDYVVSWTRWNHLRAVTGLAAALSLTLALCEWHGAHIG
ncbi:MAG TPA: anthrone oxygenase family protein [Rhizobacter sp.]|nr:anthrone oxygenase family protein [Rhizobacter sp.]